MITYTNKTFLITVKTFLILCVIGGIGPLLSRTLTIHTIFGILAVILLYGIEKKAEWVIDGLRAFSAMIVIKTLIPFRLIFSEYNGGWLFFILAAQVILLGIALMCILNAPKFIVRVNKEGTETTVR